MSRARDIANLIGGATPDIILKTATGAILDLQTSDTTVTDGSILGKINFTAPDEASGTDAILLGAAIEAVAEDTFDASTNATELVFKTGSSAAATEKMKIASTGATTITTEGNEDTLTLKSNDADANSGPHLQLNRNSSSPADSDSAGVITFRGRNDAAQAVDYANINVQYGDVSDGTEDGTLSIQTIVGGTVRDRVNFRSSGVVFNDEGQDIDFRVESDNNANMLFVDAENDRVAIGHDSPVAKLDIMGQGTASGNLSMLIGADEGGTVNPARTNATDKAVRIGMPHRTNAEEPAALIVASSTSSDNAIYIGGGTSVMNAATQVNIYAADNTTTQTGVGRVQVTGSQMVVNEAGGDYDFRVESDANTHAFFVEGNDGGGQPSIGFGVSDPTKLGTSGTAALGGGAGAILQLNGDDSQIRMANHVIHSDNGSNTILHIRNNYGLTNAGAELSLESGHITFNAGTSFTQIAELTSDGFAVDANGDFNPGNNTGSADAVVLDTNGKLLGAAYQAAVAIFNRMNNDGQIVSLRQNGTEEGSISVSGTTVTYGNFTGAHESRFTDNSKPDIPIGTILENIDEMMDWYYVEFKADVTRPQKEDDEDIAEEDRVYRDKKEPIALPEGKSVGDTIDYEYEGKTYTGKICLKDDFKHTKCKISDTSESTRVYGVFSKYDSDTKAKLGINDISIAALGTHRVRVNKDVTVNGGDLLVSNGDGTAKVQSDGILSNKTIGKVLTNIKQNTYDDGSYTVPCSLYCG